MTESIVILPARLEWAESFRSCVDLVAKEKKYFLMTEAPVLERIRDFLAKLNTAGHPHFFAVKGNRVVGWCNVKRFDSPARAHAGELSMGLHPQYRGQGLGKKLILACLRECRILDYHKVELTVFTDNERAIRLYESLGFEQEGYVKDYARLSGAFKDAWIMGQIL